jgi:hypothetical protein
MTYRFPIAVGVGIAVCLYAVAPQRICAAEQENEPNDLQRRRQVLDQVTMCILPNGSVRLDADH